MKKKAVCERTGKMVSVGSGYFVGNTSNGAWAFVSYEAPEMVGDYPILGADLVSSPEELVDWLAHLYEKAWFRPWRFCKFMHEFRASNRLYGG